MPVSLCTALLVSQACATPVRSVRSRSRQPSLTSRPLVARAHREKYGNMGVLAQVIGGFAVVGLTTTVSLMPFMTYCYSLIFACASLTFPACCRMLYQVAQLIIEVCSFRRKTVANARTPKMAASGIEHPPVKGVVHETADCEGCRIHIARAGVNPAKKCILFIHGFPECVRTTLTDCQPT